MVWRQLLAVLAIFCVALPAYTQAPLGVRQTDLERCEKTWLRTLDYENDKLNQLLLQISEIADRWSSNERKQVRELTEELAHIQAELAYCRATYGFTEQLPDATAWVAPLTDARWPGVEPGPAAWSLNMRPLFASTNCERCRDHVLAINDYVLFTLRTTLIRNYLWGDFAAPGELQEEAATRSINRVSDTETFEARIAAARQALRLCEQRRCGDRPKTGTAALPAQESDTSVRRMNPMGPTLEAEEARKRAAEAAGVPYEPLLQVVKVPKGYPIGGAGVINVVTKRGTTEWKGSGMLFDEESWDEKARRPGSGEQPAPRHSQQPVVREHSVNVQAWGRETVGVTDELIEQLASANPQEVLVAMVDSGVDFSHPDLAGAFWHNVAEHYNYRDDDGNGLVDDVSGWNFRYHDAHTWDDNGHGTLVAGIIASRGDDANGMAGVNPWARLLPLKATDYRGEGDSFGVAAAITYAVNAGARVINISLGGERVSAVEKIAVDYAKDKDVLVVVAAGNQNTNTRAFWPAGLDNVITVAASGSDDRRAAWSNWGSAVDIAAPGTDILSLRAQDTDPMALAADDYETGANIRGADGALYVSSGTSFAAPFVAGTASLLFSVNPELTAVQVRNMLLNSAVDIETPGIDPLTGYGRLDAAAALQADPDYFISGAISGVATANRDGELLVLVNGWADAGRFDSARVEYGEGEAPASWQLAGEPLDSSVTDGELAAIPAVALRDGGRWTLRLIVRHKNGDSRETRFDLKLK